MEIKITSQQTLTILQVISWILFLGLAVEAGALLVNMFIAFFINPNQVKIFWEGKEYLTALQDFDRSHFITLTICMLIVAILKAIMFYLISAAFSKKELRQSKPFNPAMQRFINTQGFIALGIGCFSNGGHKFTNWLTQQGLPRPDLQELHLSGADVWVFMAVILFIIVQLVKRGISIQQENDLTI